jgi:glycerol-3-phosphate O-acyltransferase/dihydroxyacetone phosphate acyltransferase
MLYRTLRWLIKCALKLYFKRVFVTNKDYLKSDGPVIVASNHPNSFCDAYLLGVLIEKEFSFLVRSDVFRTKWSNFILRSLNMLPIYRREEGSADIHRNNHTFEETRSKMAKNHLILIFCEGKCVLEKRVRPIKKGTARLALESEAKHNFKLNLSIIPTGINYTYGHLSNSEVFIDFAKPILVANYKSEYLQHPQIAIANLTLEIEKRITDLVVIIENQAEEPLIERQLRHYRAGLNYPILKWEINNNERLIAEKKICNTVTHNEKVDSKIIAKTNSIFQLTIPFYILGYLLHLVPEFLIKTICNKVVSYVEFYASVRISLSIFIYLFYYICISVVVIKYFNYQLAVIIVLAMLILGIVANLHTKMEKGIPNT